MKSLNLLVFTSVITLLSACGGGGSDSKTESSPSDAGSGSSPSEGGNTSGGGPLTPPPVGGGTTSESGGSYSLVDPITPLTMEITTEFGLKQKVGFSGDIEIVQKSSGFEYQLKNGKPSLNITDVTRVESSRFDCPASNTEIKGKGSGIVTYHYKTGEVISKISGSGYVIDCTYKLTPFAGTTITDNTSIKELFEWGEDYEDYEDYAISMSGSACPNAASGNTTSANGKTPTDEEQMRLLQELLNCKIESVRNFTATDDANKTHKIAQAGSLSFGFLLLFMVGFFRRLIK